MVGVLSLGMLLTGCAHGPVKLDRALFLEGPPPKMPVYEEGDPISQVNAQTWLADLVTYANDAYRKSEATKALALTSQ